MRFQRPDGEWAEYRHSMNAANLEKLDGLLAASKGVIALRDVAQGNTKPGFVAMRHDVDHNLEHAVQFAEWEAERGYQATYFVLHTAWYYDDKPALYAGLERLVDLGHEVGLHSNATVLAASAFGARERWENPATRFSTDVIDRLTQILDIELALLRDAGFEITGVAAHGDIRCYQLGVYNDLRFTRLDLERFGLLYDADRLARGARKISDNHGKARGSWRKPETDRQTFALLHPCHWSLPVREPA